MYFHFKTNTTNRRHMFLISHNILRSCHSFLIVRCCRRISSAQLAAHAHSLSFLLLCIVYSAALYTLFFAFQQLYRAKWEIYFLYHVKIFHLSLSLNIDDL